MPGSRPKKHDEISEIDRSIICLVGFAGGVCRTHLPRRACLSASSCSPRLFCGGVWRICRVCHKSSKGEFSERGYSHCIRKSIGKVSYVIRKIAHYWPHINKITLVVQSHFIRKLTSQVSHLLRKFTQNKSLLNPLLIIYLSLKQHGRTESAPPWRFTYIYIYISIV